MILKETDVQNKQWYGYVSKFPYPYRVPECRLSVHSVEKLEDLMRQISSQTHSFKKCDLKWSDRSGHLAKTVKCHNEASNDNRDERREYTEDFKRDTVALVTEQGYKTSVAARSLSIGDNLIRRWKQGFEEEASGARLSSDEREELQRLRMEKEIFLY
jgi:transposase